MKNSKLTDWEIEIVSRFADRENLSKEELHAHYFALHGLLDSCVFECLNLIESEYGVPVGLLRPSDKLEKLFEAVKARTPWKWLEYQVIAGDRQTELQYQLTKRMKFHGSVGKWEKIETIGDFVCAWCGKEPLTKIS